MTEPAPALVTFAPHPADYSPEKASWFIQEDYSENTKFTPTDHSTHIYTPGGQIVRVLASAMTTLTSSDFLNLLAARDATLTEEWQWGPAESTTWAPTQHDFDIQPGDGYWPSTLPAASNLYIAWQRLNTDLTLTTKERLWWSNLVVVHKRHNYAGQPIDLTGDFKLTARQVVEDLMGRGVNQLVEWCPERVDPDTPWDTTVLQAAWWYGVSAKEVLAFAVVHAPNMWWAVWEPGPSRLPKFEVGRWNGPVRYVFPSGADVQLSGGAGDVANRALVRYVGSVSGQTRTVWVAEVRVNVATLAKAGVTRTVMLDLTSEGLMTTANARLRGISALQETARTRTTGKVVIRQAVFDRIEGRMVQPWEVKAGSPVIVTTPQTTFGRSTSLADFVGVDGISVFRGRGVAYDASRNEATLSLDGGSRSLINRLKIETSVQRYEGASPRI